jgi:group I intron endonuclease
MKISGIYLIRNKITEKYYVGASIDINRRWTRHKDELNKNKHHSPKLQNSWNKYGDDKFDFIWVQQGCSNVLTKLEQQWIDFCDSFNHGYNSTAIANNIGLLPKTEEHKRKIGIAHKGRKLTEESKNKIRQKAIGRKRPPMSDEQKIKISQANKGKKRTEEMKLNLSKAKTGIPHGRKLSDEHKTALLAGRTKNKQNAINI